MNIVLDYLKKHNIPLTRENYLAIAHLVDPPGQLGAEEEAGISEEIQNSSDESSQPIC